MEARTLAIRCAELIQAKLGHDIVLLDLRGLSPIADYFVVATAGSTVHAQALAREVEEKLKQEGERPHHVEGLDHAHWILLDFVDVVVHIFLGDVRLFYGLERLWGDVPQIRFTEKIGGQRRQTMTRGGAD
ncbi:MAG: ribosome silencing factor [candidate division WOR-3 bacterium]